MMKKIIYVAAVLLVLQIGLTVAVHTQNTTNLASTAPDAPFLSFDASTINSVEISGPKGEEVVLQKTDKGWIIPGTFSAPTGKNQVNDLLQKLGDARQGLAVATSKGAAKRFKTAKDEFERHIILKQGDKTVADVYLGTSAGLRRSYARIADQDAVVSIPVSDFDAVVDPDKWLDSTLSRLKKDDLKTVALADISLTKEEKDKEKVWLLDGTAAEETDKEAVDKLLNKVTDISVQSVLDPATSTALFEKDPVVQFTVNKKDDSKVTYAFAKQGDSYVLKMSDNELYFKATSWQVKGLADMTREKLLKGYDVEQKKEDPAAAVMQEALPQADTPEENAEGIGATQEEVAEPALAPTAAEEADTPEQTEVAVPEKQEIEPEATQADTPKDVASQAVEQKQPADVATESATVDMQEQETGAAQEEVTESAPAPTATEEADTSEQTEVAVPEKQKVEQEAVPLETPAEPTATQEKAKADVAQELPASAVTQEALPQADTDTTEEVAGQAVEQEQPADAATELMPVDISEQDTVETGVAQEEIGEPSPAPIAVKETDTPEQTEVAVPEKQKVEQEAVPLKTPAEPTATQEKTKADVAQELPASAVTQEVLPQADTPEEVASQAVEQKQPADVATESTAVDMPEQDTKETGAAQEKIGPLSAPPAAEETDMPEQTEVAVPEKQKVEQEAVPLKTPAEPTATQEKAKANAVQEIQPVEQKVEQANVSEDTSEQQQVVQEAPVEDVAVDTTSEQNQVKADQMPLPASE